MGDSRVRLTPPQTKVLHVFLKHEGAGRPPPTYAELCACFGWRSTGAARDHIAALVKKGELLTVDHGRPGAFLPPRAKKAPLINPEEAIARRFTQIGQISLPSFMHPGGGAFAMNVPDDAMAGAGVSQNDVIVANRSADGQPGFLAVIQVKRELLVRRVESRAGRLVAVSVPRSGRRESHRVSKKSIRGRVTGLLRDYKGT